MIKDLKAERGWFLEELFKTKSKNMQRHWSGSIFEMLEEQQRSLWVWSRVNKGESTDDGAGNSGEG